MKRDKQSMRKGRTPAPYTKYGKRPHQYSEAYRRWRHAVTTGIARDEADIAHRRLMEREARLLT